MEEMAGVEKRRENILDVEKEHNRKVEKNVCRNYK